MNIFLPSAYRTALAGCVVLAFAGCSDRDLRPLNPCTFANVSDDISIENVDEVDLLFMVDNSNSMEQEQASLTDEIPRLVRVLASGVLTDPDTGGVVREFPPVRSLRVGVISSDMGAGGNVVPTCTNSSFGDDGLLIDRGNVASMGRACEASYPSFLEFERDPGESEEDETARITQLANDVACVAELGTDGCGFEQQLEAILKSTTPASSELRFQEGTRGNGDVNRVEGSGSAMDPDDDQFVRPNSLLAIVALTDEDDCSVREPDLYNPSSTRFRGDLNLRCFNHPEAVHPVSRYVNGLLALRASQPSLLVYAAIVGIPVRLAPGRGEVADFDTIPADRDMQERVDPDNPNRLETSCNVPGRGLAFPPRRMVQVAQELQERGAAGVVQSICQRDFGPALDTIIDKIADALGGTCLPRPLNRNAQGLVACQVTELLPANGDPTETQCDMIEGRSLIAVVPTEVEVGDPPVTRVEDRQLCLVNQLTEEEFISASNREIPDRGWVYDDFFNLDPMTGAPEGCSEDRPQRISFVEGAGPVTGSILGFECLQGLEQEAEGNAIAINDTCFLDNGETQQARDGFCGQATTIGAEGFNPPLADQIEDQGGTRLFCEPVSTTCQLACETDANCPGGFVCQGVDLEAAGFDAGRCNVPAASRPPDCPFSVGVCINPTCSAN
ncbi:MAG: hypothetical protein AAGH15_02595 [Myxococcota bacterium]